MSSDRCLISQMLNDLKTARSSMKMQTSAITDVMDKSNNVLLQIEASRSLKPATNDNSTPYTYNKETVNALTRIVDTFVSILRSGDQPPDSNNFEEYLEAAAQRSEYLSCNVRKLLAISDTIQQMRMALEQLELNSTDDAEGEECIL